MSDRTACAGCGRSMTPLTKERAVWYCGDGTIYGWCCWKLATTHLNSTTEKTRNQPKGSKP